MVTASQVKALREKTGAGMMDCKKALSEANGDMDEAEKILREKGIAQAAKRAGRTAAEGRVSARIAEDGATGVLVEVNCETDFVARNNEFGGFVDVLATHVLGADPGGDGALGGSAITATGKSVDESLTELTAVLGEKMVARRYARFEAGSGSALGSYVHPGDRVAVVVELQNAGGADAAARDVILRDVAMQIASMHPLYATKADVPAEWFAREQEIAVVQAKESGKPENVLDRITEGKVKARLKDVCLVDQVFVKAAKKETVGQYVSQAGKAAGAPDLAVARFARFQLGEGLAEAEESGS